MEKDTILSISPIDGRYEKTTSVLNEYFGEYAYIKYRVKVECKWLEYFVSHILGKEINVDSVYELFNVDAASRVKEIERTTNHDVKAIEYYVREEIEKLGYGNYLPYVHFACTSEDINNLSYAMSIHDAMNDVVIPKMKEMIECIKAKANEYKDVAVLAHTHGQPATPTTLGKELAVFVYRLNYMLDKIQNIRLKGKFSGAVGNFAAHSVAYPDVNWIEIASDFVESLGVSFNPLVTQIESHDTVCELFSYIKLFNNILLDYNSDMWMYISMKYFKQKVVATETGSSVMPHKVNPINHENSMANIRMANGIIDTFTNNLQVSRMQRDLSDSSMQRNLGVAIAHSMVSYVQSITATGKMEADIEYITKDLRNNPEVLAEAIQTVLRKNGYENAYELLKAYTRGKSVDLESLREFVNSMDNLNEEDKQMLLGLTPTSYTGLSSVLVEYMDK